jgi:hypothetical protein
MATQTLFLVLLALHLTGFALFVGTTVVDMVLSRQALVLTKLPLLMRAGIGLAILAGIGMMALTKGAFGEQTWLRIKVPLVIIAGLNAIITRKRLLKAEKDLTAYYITQLFLCAVIITLSVFKFN